MWFIAYTSFKHTRTKRKEVERMLVSVVQASRELGVSVIHVRNMIPPALTYRGYGFSVIPIRGTREMARHCLGGVSKAESHRGRNQRCVGSAAGNDRRNRKSEGPGFHMLMPDYDRRKKLD